MGLAASQARFLFLTARKTNLEYEAQQISQARAMLAQSTETIALAYEKAMANTCLYFVDENTSNGQVRLTYTNLTRSKYPSASDPLAETGLGCRLVDCWGKIVVPEFPSKEEMAREGTNETNYHIDQYVTDPDYLNKVLKDGTYTIQESTMKCDEEGYLDPTQPYTWTESIPYTSVTGISEDYDKSDDKTAEAEYTTKTAEVQQQDKTLELRLNQIQTEQKEVETEMEGVSSLIKKETEVFKTTFNA